jgi:hypothetical protein
MYDRWDHILIVGYTIKLALITNLNIYLSRFTVLGYVTSNPRLFFWDGGSTLYYSEFELEQSGRRGLGVFGHVPACSCQSETTQWYFITC